MESKSMFQKNTCNVQQIAVISKIHNMQWLKNNPPLPGHIKPKTNKGIVKGLKEDLRTSELTTESTMSVPNISATDNLLLVNSTNIVSTASDNKYNCDIESKIDESKEFIGDVEVDMTRFNQQMLILQELEQDEMISMAIEDSLFSLEREEQRKLEEENKGKEQDTSKCDLTSLKIKGCTSEINQEDIHDNNNNDKLNIKNEPDLKTNDIRSDTLSSEGADKGDQSNNIYLNKETDISLNLKNLNEISVANDNAATPIPSTMSKNNEFKEKSECEVMQSLGKKEVSKVITKNAAPASTLNKKNNVTLGQSTESKMKYGIKQSLKNLSAETIRKTPDKKNNESSQSTLNTSKVLRSKSYLQPKKEATFTKHSPDVTARHTIKNLKESDQNKTTSLNTVNKHKLNRMNYTPKKEESGSTPKVHNVSKIVQHTVKETTNYSKSPNSAQSTNKPLSTTEKKILKTSDAANKYEDMKQKTTLKNDEGTETLTSKEECGDRSGVINKIFVDIIDKEVKESNKSNITNLTNEHSTNEYVKLNQANTNPFLEDFPNVLTSNNSQTDTMDFKDITGNALSIKTAQFGNAPSTTIPYVLHIPQQNAQQEQISSHQNFVRYIPDQFIMDGSVNTALPKFHSNAPYTNVNTVQLGQYGNMQTTQSVPSGAQVQNCSSPNVIPPSTGNMNTVQYQMPNVLSHNNQNVIRPPPNFCIHPMPQEEQFNMPAYGLQSPYFINPICVCRNDCFPLHPQHWNLPHNYSVPIQQSPYNANYNPFCNQPMQSNNIIHKNTIAGRPLKAPIQAQIPQEQNIQRNYGKPVYNTGCNIRNPQNNKIYDTNLQTQRSVVNTREGIDFKKEKSDGESLSDKESNNLPMISPKACMIYGSGLSKDCNTTKPQTKYSGPTNSVSNCHFQYQKNNEYRNISKEYLPPDLAMSRGKTRFNQTHQPSYKAQY